MLDKRMKININIKMDYETFYGFDRKPFSTSPDERFYFNSTEHSRAMKKLLHGIENRLGLSVLIADIGMGKTTLARRMLNILSSDNKYEVSLLVIIHPDITAGWLLKKMSLQLGVDVEDEERVKTISELYKKLQTCYDVGKKVAVLIDEANMLRGKDIMEEIRGLLNIETQSIHLINFVLFGLPEMEENLKQDEALYQRIAIRTTLNPLDLKSVHSYIVHRIRIAGGQNIPFTDKSFGLIHNYSGGKPRLVNIICENALLEGFLEKKKEIDSELINIVLTDLALVKSEND
ncbi:MAG: AAA family ATPase [Candidatus Stahlbacteria bacterium]|nr:MAG: AAA family ATPase [Candidatus Stahlbacteria bacterium]